jgi:hypothetical protein
MNTEIAEFAPAIADATEDADATATIEERPLSAAELRDQVSRLEQNRAALVKNLGPAEREAHEARRQLIRQEITTEDATAAAVRAGVLRSAVEDADTELEQLRDAIRVAEAEEERAANVTALVKSVQGMDAATQNVDTLAAEAMAALLPILERITAAHAEWQAEYQKTHELLRRFVPGGTLHARDEAVYAEKQAGADAFFEELPENTVRTVRVLLQETPMLAFQMLAPQPGGTFGHVIANALQIHRQLRDATS